MRPSHLPGLFIPAAYSLQKCRALAAVLASSIHAEDNERLTYGAILRVLEPLEAEHIQVLQGVENLQGKQEGAGGDDAALSAVLPHLTVALPYVVSTLLATGLIRDSLVGKWAGVEGSRSYILAALGVEVLAILREQERDTP